MHRIKLQLTRVAAFLIGIMVALSFAVFQGTISLAQAETTYWLGVKDGEQLHFTVRVPTDAVAVILHQEKAPKRDDSTKPRYRTFTHTIDGKNFVFHGNEIGWETPKLANGNLSWVVNAGVGAAWRRCNTKDPLWNDFAEGLSSIATPFSRGWSQAKVIMLESTGTEPPQIRTNWDGTIGQPSAEATAIAKLTAMNEKDSLSPEELDHVREYMLEVANAGRANPEYRRQMGSKVALNLPSDLKPLVLGENHNNAAQNQAEYCAKIKKATHAQDDPTLATLGLRLQQFNVEGGFAEAAGGGNLQNYPTNWMKSDTHYRPWWNLDEQVTTVVGFGIAKGDDGKWYAVAVFGR